MVVTMVTFVPIVVLFAVIIVMVPFAVADGITRVAVTGTEVVAFGGITVMVAFTADVVFEVSVVAFNGVMLVMFITTGVLSEMEVLLIVVSLFEGTVMETFPFIWVVSLKVEVFSGMFVVLVFKASMVVTLERSGLVTAVTLGEVWMFGVIVVAVDGVVIFMMLAVVSVFMVVCALVSC